MFAAYLRRATLVALVTSVACVPPAAAGAGPAPPAINVFLVAGQSNAAGADSVVADPPGFLPTASDRATRFTTSRIPVAADGGGYTPWGEIRGHRLSAGGKLVHGPEVGFTRRLHEAGWRDVAVIKVHANFSRDVKGWPWNLDGTLGRAWTAFVDARLAELAAKGHRYRVRGFVWHQGIDDAIHGKLAADYRKNLSRLIGALRKRYGDEKTPFVLARSVNSPLAPKETMAAVRRAQVAVAGAVPWVGWADVDDLPNVNRHHFTAAGQLTIGRRLADEFLRIAAKDEPVDVGSRRELFVDDHLIARLTGKAELRLHHPTRREVVLVHDAPWEGTGCGYHTIFRDGDVVRAYYVAADLTSKDGTKMAGRPIYACYAESKDGIRWTKPELGLFAVGGSKRNNVIWSAPGLDNISVFKDPNPACKPDEKYKAVTSGPGGLYALKSADGLRWSRLTEKPIITKGAFDTQNVAFWDPLRKHYWCYVRDFHQGVRDIRVATSADFRTWTTPEMLRYAGSPDEALYTNQVLPYYRAPHLFVGFPTRYVERAWSPAFHPLPDREHRERRMKFHPRYGTAVTDGLFMTSRDGRTFRRWGEAFIRPGIERRHNWLYGDGYQNWGLLETASEDPDAPPELSVYVIEDNWKRPTRLRRYTLRLDGFVSVHAPLRGGELLTKPLRFGGRRLALNFSTSAAGSIRVELQDVAGKPLPGFTLADCHEVFGDALERVVTWKNGSDVSALAGKPVRVRFVLRDADLYAMQFRSGK